MDEEAPRKPGFDRLEAIWTRRKWLAILVFTVPLSAILSVVTFLPNIYRSTATVIVDRQQVPEEFVKPTVTSALETRLQTISQEIVSRSRLESLITRFGLYADLRKRLSSEEVVERMRSDISLELKGVDPKGRGGATIAFAIGYVGSNPQTVAQVTNTIASFYVEENLKVRERQAAGTAEFLKIQLQDITKRLDIQEQRVSEFRKRYIGELPQQMAANLATLEQLNTQLRLNNVSQLRAGEKRDLIAMQLPEMSPTGTMARADTTAMRIAQLKQELVELRTRFSERYPDVVRAKTELATLERQAAQETPDVTRGEPEPSVSTTPQVLRLRQALGEAETEAKVLKDEDKRLRSAIALYESRVSNAPRREQEFQEISRDYDTTKELYHSLLKRYDEAQLAESMEQRQKGEQFRILDPAVPSADPAAPKRLRLMLLGLGLSLGLAVVSVLVAEQYDTSFHMLDDLRAFANVPVLASIPRLITDADVRRQQLRFRLAGLWLTVVLALIVGGSYLVAHGNEQLVWLLTRSGSS
jgi:polysaccharide biosynthesis transport protein